tara:strand:+ start:112 stop:1341 length:1230 start_codon:yes stop_codon:yes gene_type:complete
VATIVTTVTVAFDGSAHTDISANVTNVGVSYGRQRLIDEFSAGHCNITYDNRDNSLTPGHSDSTYGNTQLIGREVRVSTVVTGGANTYPTYLFRGIITDVNYVAGQDTSTVTLSVVDGFEKLGRASVFNETFVSQKGGARVSAILDLASVSYPNSADPQDRDIGIGTTTMDAATGVTGNALDLIQQVTRTDNGQFLINHAGKTSATNFGGVAFWEGQGGGSDDWGIIFSDDKTLPSGSVQMEALTLEFGSELLFNAYEFTDSTGTIHTGKDTDSITKYGQRTLKRTMLSSGLSTENAGEYFIGLYAEPELRISTVTTDIDSMPTNDAEKCLQFNVRTATTLSYLPSGSSTTMGGQYIVEGVSYNISVRDMATNSSRITATYSTSAADTTAYWVLGDLTLGDFPTILAPG